MAPGSATTTSLQIGHCRLNFSMALKCSNSLDSASSLGLYVCKDYKNELWSRTSTTMSADSTASRLAED